jgi:flagellar M-ring protein FliF
MPDWQTYLGEGRRQLARVPTLGWVAAGVIGLSLGVALYLETGAPPYVALYEGLSPADGGTVIAQLQKLGIPYELEAAGDVILVPQSQLAAARLQLGAAQIPHTTAANGWDRVEDAPMTASDLAQSTMADQALEASLAESINSLSVVGSAQVFVAMPQDTPFLADQPKPTASVVIAADDVDATADGPAIASLVAGAVPGLQAQQVTVTTTKGTKVFPTGSQLTIGSQFAQISAIENLAVARVTTLLLPLVGSGHFRVGASADLDFTHEQVHQVDYGPNQLVSHQERSQSAQTGNQASAIGIPGALSNEPPSATTAVPPPAPATGAPATAAAGATGATGAAAPAGATGTPSSSTATSAQPQHSSSSSNQTFVTDQSESDITKPDWTVRAIAISAVLDKAALKGMTIDQVKAAIAGAFSYPRVSVNVLAAPFVQPPGLEQTLIQQAVGPLSHAILEVLAAVAVLFGVAVPMGRRISMMAIPRRIIAVPAPRSTPVDVTAELPPPLEFTSLREQAAKNVPGVARLLQSWVDDLE